MKNTNDIIAQNLTRLMQRHRIKQVELAKKSGVSQRTISNILNPGSIGSTTTQSIEKLAEYFGLQAYEMMIPNFPIDENSAKNIEKIIDCYAKSTPDSRENIKRVAELEVRYAINQNGGD